LFGIPLHKARTKSLYVLNIWGAYAPLATPVDEQRMSNTFYTWSSSGRRYQRKHRYFQLTLRIYENWLCPQALEILAPLAISMCVFYS